MPRGTHLPREVPSFPPKLEGGLVKLADVRPENPGLQRQSKAKEGEGLELTANRWGFMMKKEEKDPRNPEAMVN